MALAEICGMENSDAFKNENAYQNDLFKFTKNFSNNLELAVPPFPNVSNRSKAFL